MNKTRNNCTVIAINYSTWMTWETLDGRYCDVGMTVIDCGCQDGSL